MKKEHFKNLVLIILIISNFMLSQRIFANKKLWLFGYNFFSNTGTTMKNDDYITAIHITVPEKIFVNTGYQSSRFTFSRGSSQFNKIYQKAQDIIYSAFSAPLKNVSETSKESWYSVLSGKSLYLSFGCEFTPQLYAELLGIHQTNISVNGFSHISINADGNLYIMDNKNDIYYKVLITDSSVKSLIEQIMLDYSDTESIINYSYELNFDKDFGDQKTFISPMVPVYSSPIFMPTVFGENPIIKNDGINNNVIEKILSTFSINPNTVRRYTEADGTLVFVENNGVLKISTNGIIHFIANDTGIELSGGNHPIVSLSRFIDSINVACGSQKDLVLTSNTNSESFTFDYLVSDYAVKFNEANAVSATVANGYLKEYTHILRRYSPVLSSTSTQSFIEALDDTIVYYQDSMKEIRITQMFPAYEDSMNIGELKKSWHININNIIAE